MDQQESEQSTKDKIGPRALIFQTGNEKIALEIDKIREITNLSKITQVPKAPVFIEGIVNLRGRIITVLNLVKQLGFESIGWNEETSLIILEIKSLNLGLLVERVLRVETLSIDIMENPIPIDQKEQKIDIFKGVIKINNEIISLIDINKLLNNLLIFEF